MGRSAPPAWLALVPALAVAVGAVVLLSPAVATTPLDVDAAAYFTPAERQRADAYRPGQRWLALGGLAAQALAVVAVAALVRARGRRGRPRRSRHRRPRRDVLRGAATGAALGATLVLVAAPFGALARGRALDVGLATGSWGLWAIDLARGTALVALAGAVAGATVVLLLRRLPRLWWLAASVLAVLAAVAVTFARPLVLDPLANDLRPVEDPALVAEVRELARRAGVEVGRVEVIDASRRTTAANAYVAGLGPTRRVVVYDTLLRGLPRSAVRAVVAHELAHVAARDVPRGLLFAALVVPPGLFAAGRIAERLTSDAARGPGPPGVAALAVGLAVVAVPLSVAGDALSRRAEAAADLRALALTRDPDGQIDLHVGLAVTNVADPDPPVLWRVAFGTHPTTVQRIGLARAMARASDPGPTRR